MGNYLSEKESSDSFGMGFLVGAAVMLTACIIIGALMYAVSIEKRALKEKKEQIKIEKLEL
jgi:hypothetical protein